MRRFLLTYRREGEPFIEIEGIQFSDGRVVLDCYPDNEWTGTREFRDFALMEFVINEFGVASVEWLDEEPRKQFAKADIERILEPYKLKEV